MNRKWIKRAIIGSLLITMVVAGLGFAAYKWAKQYYYEQLENLIVDRYLEGEDAIGAYAFSPEISTTLYSNEYKYQHINMLQVIEEKIELDANAKDWPSDLISLRGEEYSIMNLGRFINPIYGELADCNKFAWWISVNPLNKFMVVKKTRKGFEFIDEYIMGIGFKYLPPCSTKTTKLFNKSEVVHTYSDFSLCGEYINYLIDDKYKDVYLKRNANVHDILEKDLRLNTWRANHEGGNLYFGNGFYELRPDYNYLDKGNVYTSYNTYGNNYYSLYNATVTVKYSIQECKGILEDLVLNVTLGVMGIFIIIYLVYCWKAGVKY